MEQRVAIVTGGLRGLGRAMALRPRARRVTGRRGRSHRHGRRRGRSRRPAHFAGRVWPLVADLRGRAECDRVVAAALERFGAHPHPRQQCRADLHLYRPARFRRPEPQKFWQVSDEIVDKVIATNIMAADQLARRVAPGMVGEGWGRIVNVTTKLDTMNRLRTHPYGASKAALEMATEVWAKETEGTGLTINIVNPGAGAKTPEWPRRCAQ